MTDDLKTRARNAVEIKNPTARRQARWQENVLNHWQTEWAEHPDTQWVQDYTWGWYKPSSYGTTPFSRKERKLATILNVTPFDENKKSIFESQLVFSFYLIYDPSFKIFDDDFTLMAYQGSLTSSPRVWHRVITLADLGEAMYKAGI